MFNKTGKFGEKIAKQYLENKGYKILEINYHSRFGEIDLICREDKALVFVEVKTRKTLTFGYPEQAITKQKQERLVKTVQEFLKDYQDIFKSIRIDAISVRLKNKNQAIIGHLKNIIQDLEINELNWN